MTKQQWKFRLFRLSACDDALDWFDTQDSMESAWKNCQRGDWMLWLLGMLAKTEDDRKQMVPAVAGCARLALPYVPQGELRPGRAIRTYEAWGRGEATISDVRLAASAAYDARIDHVGHRVSYNAINAVYESTLAARAAKAAGNIIYGVADTVYEAIYNDASNNYIACQAAYDDTLARCADIVRESFPYPKFEGERP